MIIAGKYEVIGELGRGGMGLVYQARHTTLGATYAVKTVPAHIAAEPEYLLRFQQEAQVMAALRHPNIVRVVDIGEDQGTHYLVMECVEGESLRQLLAASPTLPLGDVVRIGLDVAAALGHAHSHVPPIVHRDIKPSNILVDGNSGRALVTDFGIAKLLGSDVLRTKTGMVIGTVKYCSPEQLDGSAIDPRVDVFALGLVLCEMVAGRHPLEGLDEKQLLARALDRGTEYPLQLPGTTPADLRRLIERATAKDRARRHPTMGALHEALADVQRSLSTRTLSVTSLRDTRRSAARMALPAAGVAVLIGTVFFAGFRMERAGYFGSPAATDRLQVDDDTAPAIPSAPRAIGVMEFASVTPDPSLGWMRDVIRDNLSSRLSGASNCKVFSKEFLDFKAQGLLKSGAYSDLRAATMRVAEELGVTKAIFGRYRTEGSRLVIEAHVVDMQTGLQEPVDAVQGEMDGFTDLQGQLARKLMVRLDVKPPVESVGSTAGIDDYKLLLDAEGAQPIPADVGPKDRVSGWATHAWRLAGLLRYLDAAPAAAEDMDIRDAILATIEKYRRAYQEKDLGLLAEVYGSLSPEQSRAASQYFANAQNLVVTIDDVDVAIDGDRAAVSYTRHDRFNDVKTGDRQALQVRLTKMLVRGETGWTIAPSAK